MGMTTIIAQEQAVTAANALAAALRRRRAVFTNPPEVPQPATASHVRDIADLVREWSVGECDASGTRTTILVLNSSKHAVGVYARGPRFFVLFSSKHAIGTHAYVAHVRVHLLQSKHVFFVFQMFSSSKGVYTRQSASAAGYEQPVHAGGGGWFGFSPPLDRSVVFFVVVRDFARSTIR